MNLYLSFSDAAKYADLARNIVNGFGYHTSFSFFLKPFFTGQWIPPVMPFSIALFFKIFGVSDFAVIATSFFYFLLTLVFVYLLAQKVFGSKFVGLLSTLAVGFDYNLINYATNGASESPFIFEIVAASYFVTLKKKWANIAVVSLLVLMYFTRPQAFIYIAGIILYWLLLNFKTKKALIYFGLTCIAGLLVDRFILTPLSGKFFLYSILGRGTNVLSQVGIGQSASDQLRSGVLTYKFSILESLKKIFYNLYNFYKLLPQILNPYLFILFIIGILKKENKEFKIASLFMVATTLLVTAASIPFFRYIHPIVPLVYIITAGTIYELGFMIYQHDRPRSSYDSKLRNRNLFIILTSLFIILFFGVGQTIGVLILDSRFDAKTHNVGKPPVYVVLSKILKDNTKPNQTIVTNLDTWGSWYGERKTIWYPLSPQQLKEENFDAIYLTNYLIDDQNYYMGSDWRKIFSDPKNQTVLSQYKFAGEFDVSAADNYDNINAKALLLVRK